MNQLIADIGARFKPIFDDMRVELFAHRRRRQLGACFEEEGEGEVIRLGRPPQHPTIERDRIDGVLSLEVSSNDSIPYEGVGLLDGIEDFFRIIEAAIVGNGIKLGESTC